MFGLSQKKLEKIATKTSIWVGVSIAVSGVLFIIDELLRIDFFPDNLEKFGAAIMGVAFIILVVGIFISAMLNVSRIANSIEEISEKLATTKNIVHLADSAKNEDDSEK
jgi:Na+-transporting methylmalonyl-CoA/oxaloacetate decarboxylase gamma subunit